MMDNEASMDPVPTDALSTKLAIECDDLQHIIGALSSRGFRVIGPTPRDGAGSGKPAPPPGGTRLR